MNNMFAEALESPLIQTEKNKGAYKKLNFYLSRSWVRDAMFYRTVIFMNMLLSM